MPARTYPTVGEQKTACRRAFFPNNRMKEKSDGTERGMLGLRTLLATLMPQEGLRGGGDAGPLSPFPMPYARKHGPAIRPRGLLSL
jgi:hypothetical protein